MSRSTQSGVTSLRLDRLAKNPGEDGTVNLANLPVLVTGGAGFIPSYVVEGLVSRGANVTVIDDLSGGSISNLDGCREAIEFVDLELNDPRVAAIVAQQRCVFHLGANADVPLSVADPDLDFRSNVTGSYNVMRAALNSDVEKFVFASSAAVYGEPQYTPIDESHPTLPISPYGASKLAIERLGIAYHATYGFGFSAIRIFNTYGIRQPRYVMYDLLRKLQADPTALEVLGTGDQVRDYCYVTDTARCFLTVAEHGKRTDGGSTTSRAVGRSASRSSPQACSRCANSATSRSPSPDRVGRATSTYLLLTSPRRSENWALSQRFHLRRGSLCSRTGSNQPRRLNDKMRSHTSRTAPVPPGRVRMMSTDPRTSGCAS